MAGMVGFYKNRLPIQPAHPTQISQFCKSDFAKNSGSEAPVIEKNWIQKTTIPILGVILRHMQSCDHRKTRAV